MLTFKKYLEESLNRPYPSKFYDSDEDLGYDETTHEYHFKDHKGDHHSVYFKHTKEKPHEAEVAFSDPEGGWDATGRQGHHAIRVFSTMKNLIAKHAKKHPHLKEITFGSDKEERDSKFKEGSRNKLYRRFTKMAGGTTHDDDYSLNHRIPVNQGKK